MRPCAVECEEGRGSIGRRLKQGIHRAIVTSDIHDGVDGSGQLQHIQTRLEADGGRYPVEQHQSGVNIAR